MRSWSRVWLPAQVGVRSKPDELQCFIVRLAIDQDEVGPHVAIPMANPITAQRMVTPGGFQGLIGRQFSK